MSDANAAPEGAQTSPSGFDFDDALEMSLQEEARKPAPKEKAEPEKAEPKGEEDLTDKLREKLSGKKAKPKAEKKDEGKEEAGDGKEEAPEKEGKDDAGKEPADAAKGKAIKVKSGDEMVSLSPDATVVVSVNGEKQVVSLHDLRQNYAGKVAWETKFNELNTERKTFHKEREDLNSYVQKIFEKVQGEGANPETALDVAAELAGQDPVEVKEQFLRQMFEQLAPLYEMTEDEREKFFKDKRLTWREQKLNGIESSRKEAEEHQKAEAELRELKEKYAVDDEAYEFVEKKLGESGQKPTPQQVVQAVKYVEAYDTVLEAVPALKEDPNFQAIVNDVASDLWKHPGLTKEKVKAIVAETFGEAEDQERLKSISRRAAKSAEASGGEGPTLTEKPKPKNEAPMFFEDL